MNSNSDNPLNDQELKEAMFLHRGLLLNAIGANHGGLTYFPYSYRGKILNSLPSNFSGILFDDDMFNGLHVNTSPSEKDVLNLVSDAYYSILEQYTWAKYDNFIPFIGSAILSKTNYNLDDAFELTLEYRETGGISEILDEMNTYRYDKVLFDSYLQRFKDELKGAGNRFKLTNQDGTIESVANLSIFWLPFGLKDPVVEGVKRLPDAWKKRFINYFEKFKEKEGHQMLLIDHIQSLNKVQKQLSSTRFKRH